MTTRLFRVDGADAFSLADLTDEMARLSVTNQAGSDSQMVQFFQQTLSREGLEANRSVVRASIVDEDTTRLFSIGEDYCEEKLSQHQKEIQLRKIKLQYLIMERYLIEQYTKNISIDDVHNLMAEALLSQGARFVSPTKNPSSLTAYTPIPMLSQDAPLSALALECQLQRILEISVKNQCAAESSLRDTVKKIAELWRQHPSDPKCVAELISMSRYVQSQWNSSQSGTSAAALTPHYFPCLWRLREKKLLLTHIELFSPLEKSAQEMELNAVFPREGEIASGDLTDYVKRKTAFSKQALLVLKEIVANYSAVRKQRTEEYASEIAFFKTTGLYRKVLQGTCKIIPVSDFAAPFLTSPTQFLIDQELSQPTEAASSTSSGFLPVGLQKQLAKQTKMHRQPVRQKSKPKKEKAPQAEPEQKTSRHHDCRDEEVRSSIRIALPSQPEPAASSRGVESSSGKRRGKDFKVESTPSAPSQAAATNTAPMPSPQDRQERSYVKMKSIPKLQYHWHVRRWFDPASDPITQDPVYVERGYPEDVQKRIRIEHSFSPLMHQYILDRGKCFVETGKEKPTHRYTMLGEMYDGRGFSKKGVFTIAVNGEGLIYHAFFTRKTEDELCEEYRRLGFFEGKDVERVVSDKGKFFLPEDGSCVVQDDGDLVVVQDKVHNLFLAAYNLQDPFARI